MSGAMRNLARIRRDVAGGVKLLADLGETLFDLLSIVDRVVIGAFGHRVHSCTNCLAEAAPFIARNTKLGQTQAVPPRQEDQRHSILSDFVPGNPE
jgi:hypothetical protein